MRPALRYAGVLLLSACAISGPGAPKSTKGKVSEPPLPAREFRGVWVATVGNIDWPSTTGLTTRQQQDELLAILEKSVELNLNAVILQVRPACDALYDSKLEPWSEFLTGKMGKAPEPYYDPLEFAVTEAHKRGLELHAWFNPYRARAAGVKTEAAANHVSKTMPDVVKSYNKFLWLDPGEKTVQEHSLSVILDVVRRYDIDAVHMDDYFYPYKDEAKTPFPDTQSWYKYLATRGIKKAPGDRDDESTSVRRCDWRRKNVDTFIKRLHDEVRKEKPWVKVGISPFGIWRPGYPKQIAGFDQYDELYADARKWLREGWVDYFAPQLYWQIDTKAQSYPVLLEWWLNENVRNRHIWVGQYTSRVGIVDRARPKWAVSEIAAQIQLTRWLGGGGTIHFSMKAFLEDYAGINEDLKAGVYSEDSLVPASPWLGRVAPDKPSVEIRDGETTETRKVTWKVGGDKSVWQWVVYSKYGAGTWNLEVLPAGKLETVVKAMSGRNRLTAIGVSAVSRTAIEGPRHVVEVR